MGICKYNDISKNNDIKRPFDSESRIKPNWFNGKLFKFYKDKQNDMPDIWDDVKNTKTVSFSMYKSDHGFGKRSLSLSTSLGFLTVLDIAGRLFFLDIPSFDFVEKLSSHPSGCFCLVFFAVSSYLNTKEIFHVCSVFQQQISPVLFHFLS